MDTEGMLTIGQVASYSGLTARAVRHYHQMGLLPEPERDTSGYRSYPAAAVPRLIRIRTLAQAGVPLARVRELLDADPETFTAATKEIDQQLRAKIRVLQQHRQRIAQLNSSDALAVPDALTDYLNQLTALGAPPAVVTGERDYWILVAERWPDELEKFMRHKVAQLADPRIARIYRLIGQIAQSDNPEEIENCLQAAADALDELYEEARIAGDLGPHGDAHTDASFIRLIDSFAGSAHPAMPRLRELLAERGWSGWSRVEKREASEP